MKYKIGIIIAFAIMMIFWLYGMILSTPPQWLNIAYQIGSYIIGIILVLGFLYWVYSLVVKWVIKRLF